MLSHCSVPVAGLGRPPGVPAPWRGASESFSTRALSHLREAPSRGDHAAAARFHSAIKCGARRRQQPGGPGRRAGTRSRTKWAWSGKWKPETRLHNLFSGRVRTRQPRAERARAALIAPGRPGRRAADPAARLSPGAAQRAGSPGGRLRPPCAPARSPARGCARPRAAAPGTPRGAGTRRARRREPRGCTSSEAAARHYLAGGSLCGFHPGSREATRWQQRTRPGRQTRTVFKSRSVRLGNIISCL